MLPFDDAEDGTKQLSRHKKHNQSKQYDAARANQQYFEVIDEPQRDELAQLLDSLERAHYHSNRNRNLVLLNLINPRIYASAEPFLERKKHCTEKKSPKKGVEERKEHEDYPEIDEKHNNQIGIIKFHDKKGWASCVLCLWLE